MPATIILSSTLLLQAGADPALPMPDGRSALNVAIKLLNDGSAAVAHMVVLQLVNLLLDAGATTCAHQIAPC